MASALTAAVRLYNSNRYADLALVLPGLIRDAAQATPLLQSRVLQLAGSALTQARQREPARIALDRSLTAAEAAGSVLDATSAVITQCWLMLGERRSTTSGPVRVVGRPGRTKLSTASRAQVSAWGWLLLAAQPPPSATTGPARQPTSCAWLRPPQWRLALRRAAITCTPHLGPATVAMKTVENAVIDSKPGLALDLAANVPPGLRPTSDNRNRHLLDLTAANLDLRRYGAASDVLHELSVHAPAWLTAQPAAANLMRQIITRRRLLTPQMRDLAETMHLPL